MKEETEQQRSRRERIEWDAYLEQSGLRQRIAERTREAYAVKDAAKK